MCKKTSLDLFDELLNKLSKWKKVSDKDYRILDKIYYKLLGKKQRLSFPKPNKFTEPIDSEVKKC